MFRTRFPQHRNHEHPRATSGSASASTDTPVAETAGVGKGKEKKGGGKGKVAPAVGTAAGDESAASNGAGEGDRAGDPRDVSLLRRDAGTYSSTVCALWRVFVPQTLEHEEALVLFLSWHFTARLDSSLWMLS